MPDTLPLWLVGAPFLLWVVMRVAWEEGKKNYGRARIMFDDPYIKVSVPLYNRSVGLQLVKLSDDSPPIAMQVPKSELIARNDIASIVVRNCPHDFDNGRSVEDAYASVTIFEKETNKVTCEFDFPRWTENPMPGYEGNPSDHFPDNWNYRTLRANQTRNTIDFIIKNIEEENAFGFRGDSQTISKWQSNQLKIPPGDYLVRIRIYGAGLKSPPKEAWLSLVNPGVGGSIRVSKTDERASRQWLIGSNKRLG